MDYESNDRVFAYSLFTISFSISNAIRKKLLNYPRQRGIAIFFPVEWKAVSLQRKGEPAISSRNFPRQSRVKLLLPPPPPRPRGRLFSFCRRLENFLARRQPRIHEYFVGIEKLDLVVEEREGLSFHEMEINILVKFLIYIYIIKVFFSSFPTTLRHTVTILRYYFRRYNRKRRYFSILE